MTETEFEQLARHVKSVASKPTEWKLQLLDLLRAQKRPQLYELEGLLRSSESLPSVEPEVANLKLFLDEAHRWIESAAKVFARKRGRKSEVPYGSAVDMLFGPEKTLTNVKALLEQVDKMPFDSPEVQKLHQIASDVEAFQEDCQLLLEDPTTSLAVLKASRERASTFDVGFEILIDLDSRIRQCEWEQSAKELIAKRAGDIKIVLQMFRKGEELGIAYEHPVMMELKGLESAADAWGAEATALLQSKGLKTVTVAELQELVKRGHSSLFHRAQMSQVEKALAAVVAWYSTASKFFDTSEGGNFKSITPAPYAQIKRLLTDANALPITIDITPLRENVKLTDEWIARGKQTLGRTNSARSFAMMLSSLLDNIEGCTQNVDTENTYCICHKPEGGIPMV